MGAVYITWGMRVYLRVPRAEPPTSHEVLSERVVPLSPDEARALADELRQAAASVEKLNAATSP